MAGWVPNEGEILLEMVGLSGLPLSVMLYRNTVPSDGGVIYTSFTELTTGGSRAYAQKELENAITLDAMTLDKWYISTNENGRADAQYKGQSTADYVQWTFNSYDEADGYSVYGVMCYTRVIPFDAGEAQINPGDVIEGGTSGATATVTAVVVMDGAWADDDAEGWLVVKDQTGTFQNNEDLEIEDYDGITVAVSNTGTLFAGDSHKKVVIVESLTTAQEVLATVPIRYTPRLQASSA